MITTEGLPGLALVSCSSAEKLPIVCLRQRPEWVLQIARWQHEVWRDLNPGETLNQRIENVRRFLSAEAFRQLLVAGGEKPMGFVSVVLQQGLADEPWPWLTNLFVHPAMRGHGLGSRLVRRAEAYAFGLGAQGMYLLTPDRQRFYRRLGWRVVRRQWFKGREMTLMAKKNSVS